MRFTSEVRASDSSFVEMIWRTQSEGSGSFLSSAAIHWDMLVMTYQGKTTFTVQGPETKATRTSLPSEAEWVGITFKLGTFMPDLLPMRLVDQHDVTLPEASCKSFWLDSATWELPTYENADTFVNRLVRAGLLMRDPLVDDVMQNYPLDLSPRALQYRFRRATGMTHKTVQQIERARQAATLLEQGCPILDTAYQFGYFDQSHLTNSLRRYMGQTPAQILRALQPE
jgi:AraC-like DNA-binding protein